MNKILVLFAMIICNNIFAQGNLQFNQVKTFNGTLPNYDSLGTTVLSSSSTWIVPANKVWKIETKTITDGCLFLYINGSKYNDLYVSFAGSGYGVSAYNSAPIWLKAGDQILFNASCGGIGSRPFFISIIEFNITP
jgi:hypothetical protein